MATQRHPVERPSLDDVLSETERLILVEALQCLRDKKQSALDAARGTRLKPGRHFEERDFSLPQITRMLQRLG